MRLISDRMQLTGLYLAVHNVIFKNRFELILIFIYDRFLLHILILILILY